MVRDCGEAASQRGVHPCPVCRRCADGVRQHRRRRTRAVGPGQASRTVWTYPPPRQDAPRRLQAWSDGPASTNSSRGTRCLQSGSSTATPPRANLSREEPDAGNPHVRVCEGWGWQRPHLLGNLCLDQVLTPHPSANPCPAVNKTGELGKLDLGRAWCTMAAAAHARRCGDAFTLLATEPGPDVAPIHGRQMVVVERADWRAWLDLSRPEAELLRPLPGAGLGKARAGQS